ncbi:hypothetical protein GCM10022403_094930 [Streptomyces coacervatus]|uniref:Uncharacterized protein n=1 Tax=Streptomyces coacervatus TaxID=647381 RepID=A0ABP7JMK5_9ACTN
MRLLDFADPDRMGLLAMSMGAIVAGIVADEEPGIRALCMWSPAIRVVRQIPDGALQGSGWSGKRFRNLTSEPLVDRTRTQLRFTVALHLRRVAEVFVKLVDSHWQCG